MNENEAASYEDTPGGQHDRWVVEFAAARKALESWQNKGDEIDKEFRNEASMSGTFDTRLPLFTSDIQTVIGMLYGQVPRCTVTRRFGDSDDDVARLTGVILERILNTDIARDSDNYASVLRCVLMDYFLPGFGNARCRYVTGETETNEVPAETHPDTGEVLVEAYTVEKRPNEDVEIDYFHWKDWLWGPSRVLHDVPWWAHRALMTRAQLVQRFGAVGKLVPLGKKKNGEEDPWSRGEVWEIYEKDAKKVFWFCETYPEVLDSKDNPLGLEGFYPFPEPLVANLTTSKVVPRPYYALHQDQYRQINMLMSRIRELVDAVRVSGLYDKTNENIPVMLSPEGRGRLIPVANWPTVASAGGISGSVDWFPIEKVVEAISVLQGQLASEIDLLHQTTGFSDIMRGEATQAGATATEQRVKTRFGSVRIQRLQDEIARFATDLLKIKAEIVAKHFSPETICERANVRFMSQEDQALAGQAIELLKSDVSCYRVEVKPEAVALADFSAMKQERGEVLEVLTQFFSSLAPIAQQVPASTPYLLKIAQWMVAGVRGSSQIEGVFDTMIKQSEAAQAAAQANPQPPPQDPKLQAAQLQQQTQMMKGQQDIQKEQVKAQLQAQQTQLEVQADAQREENQRIQNVQEAAQKRLVENTMRPPSMAPSPGGYRR